MCIRDRVSTRVRGTRVAMAEDAPEPRIAGDYQEEEYISITVTEPQDIEVGGKKIHTTYLITTETTFPQYKTKEFSVRRRYSDFVWLRAKLKDTMERSKKGKNKGGTIPFLPGNTLSSLVGSGRFDPAFIEERRQGLERFIISVANHVICRFDTGLHAFLQDSEEDFEQVKQSS
eukprot:TRINITY_DN23994_c0_g1_i1.p1 TRINITY_DN23994_c0_g1~~TRINITY_DN23994_c0_g1_i1.p1  ORF type:complete len:174 (-),score=29.07 TRINITY_DN23994_c0_g1_i1:87-608(-)